MLPEKGEAEAIFNQIDDLDKEIINLVCTDSPQVYTIIKEERFKTSSQSYNELINGLSDFETDEIVKIITTYAPAATWRRLSKEDRVFFVNDIKKSEAIKGFKAALSEGVDWEVRAKENEEKAKKEKENKPFMGFARGEAAKNEVAPKVVKDNEIEEILLAPYSIQKNGIYKKLVKIVKEETIAIEKRICLTPFNIVAKGDNVDTNAIMFKLLVKDLKGRTHAVWKSAGDLFTRAGILELMAKDRFAFKESNVNEIEELMEQYVETIKYELPEEVTASRSGWKNNNTLFVCGSAGYTESGKSTVLQLENNTAELYTQQGTVEGWKYGAEKLFKYDAVRFKAYSSCVPIILALLGVQSFIVEQIGTSGMLKTLSHEACASMFGDPSKLLLNAKSTPKGIEAFVGYNTDLPTFIDETSTNPDDIKELIYTIANGVGRSTSNKSKGYEMPKTWKTVTLTTGENPILPANAKMGQLVRNIPLKGGVTEQLEQEVIEEIEHAIRDNYGLISDLVIKEVFDNRDKLTDIYKDYFNLFETPDTKSNTDARAKRFYAAIATAGYLLENVFGDISMEQKDPFSIVNRYYTENLINSSVFVPDHERALGAFYSWFAANRNLFEENTEHSNHKVCGCVEEDSNGKGFIFVLPVEIEKVVTDLGYNFKGCESNWKTDGIMLTHPHSKTDERQEVKWGKKINGAKTLTYKISLQDISKYENVIPSEMNGSDTREAKKPKYTPRAGKKNCPNNKLIGNFVEEDKTEIEDESWKDLITDGEGFHQLLIDEGYGVGEPVKDSLVVSVDEMAQFINSE